MDEVKRRIVEKAGLSEKLLEEFEERERAYQELGITDETVNNVLEQINKNFEDYSQKKSYFSRVVDWFKGLYQK